jgi:hypothetical protein
LESIYTHLTSFILNFAADGTAGEEETVAVAVWRGLQAGASEFEGD